MQHLQRQFKEHLKQLHDEYKKTGSSATITSIEQTNTLVGFQTFCEDYLANNKAGAPWYADDGIGVVLAGNVRVTLNRQDENANSGQMQDSGSVPVMEGKGFGSVPI